MFCFYRRTLFNPNLRFKPSSPSSFLLQPFSSSSSPSPSPSSSSSSPIQSLISIFISSSSSSPSPSPSSSPIQSLITIFTSSSSFSKNQSFTVHYLIQNLGISPKLASKLSTQVNFTNSQKPDSVITFFRNYSFTTSELSSIIKICPIVLSFDPEKTILPKINFLLSKGASNSDLVHIITQNPRFLYQNLENSITPSYNFVKRFLLSDKATVAFIKKCPTSIHSKIPARNIEFLIQNGVPQAEVQNLLKNWYFILTQNPSVFEKIVVKLKELGFDPTTTFFVVALRAKSVTSAWQQKICVYKKWGWSKENIFQAFLKHPWCMLASVEKIEAVMEFFVKEIGWESTVLAKNPILIMLSLEGTVIPRAFVLKFLESKGLIEDAKLSEPFKVTEDVFLEKFVDRFEEEASQLLKLYEEKKGVSNRVLKKGSKKGPWKRRKGSKPHDDNVTEI